MDPLSLLSCTVAAPPPFCCLQVPPELAAVQLKRRAPARPTLQQLQSNLQALGISEQQQQHGQPPH